MCYCFPTFKDLLASYRHPVFERECKGKGHFISTKFFFIYFQKKSDPFGVKINLFCEELFPLFKGGRQR